MIICNKDKWISIGLDSIFLDLDAFFTDHNKFSEVIIFKINLQYLSISLTKLITIQLALKHLIKIPDNDIFPKS